MNTRSRSAAAAVAAAATARSSDDDGAVDAVATELQSVSISFSSKKAPAKAPGAEDDREETATTFAQTIVALVNKVYAALGNAQLEKTYQRALLLELRKLRGVSVVEELSIDIMYDDHVVGHRRADIVVDFADGSRCILELKAVATGLKVEYLKQLKYYMWAFKVPHGVLVNFPRVQNFPDIDDDAVADNFTLRKLQGSAVLSNATLRKRVATFDPEIHYVFNSEIDTPKGGETAKTTAGDGKLGSAP